MEEQKVLSWEVLKSQIGDLGERLSAALKKLEMYEACKSLQIDHVCVRLKNAEDVTKLKQALALVGQTISSSQVNGREITLFQLLEPLRVGGWQTFGVELPYPKPNHAYTDGWEHAEFVLSDVQNTMDGVREVFASTFPHLDMEQLKSVYAYSEDEPHADGDQMPNPTISLKVNGVGIKFHAYPIQVIVGFEKLDK